MGAAAGVAADRPVALDLSCKDWAERLRRGQSLVPALSLNRREADRAAAIFNKLRLADVPGTPTLEEAGGDWFRDIVRAMFGSLDQTTLDRHIRELFLLVPKKNAKTTQGALLMLTALLMNRRPRGKFILTAPVQDVTEIAFEAAAGAIMLDEVLREKLHIRDHLKTIIHRESKAELEVMTFDPSVLTGQKCAGVLIDELHVVAKMAKASSAIRQLRGGMLPFPEAFLAFITTQSEEPPAGAFRAELLKARAIRDGKQVGHMLPVLYELPKEIQEDPAQWQDPAIWQMVTPNAGRSVHIPRLIEEFDTAKTTSEEELRAWASQHLNVEIGVALQSDGWVGAQFWEGAAVEDLPLEDVLARSEVVTVGIDGGGLDDMLGLAVIGREEKTGNWLSWTHAWMHPIVLERRKKEASRFLDFERDGDLTIVQKIGDDVEEVADYVEQCEESGLLDRIGVDQAGIGGIVDAITDRGIEHDRVVGIPQGWKLVGAIKTTERRLAEKTLLHGGRPLMGWCVGNAKVEPRGNAVIITKQLAGSAKIDPLMALYDAVALMAMNPKPRKKKYQVLFLG
jgi:phage terminase large subunit-like protein